MQLNIPQSIAALLPILSAGLAGKLSHDQLSAGQNAIIAIIAIIATAGLCVWLAGNFTGNAAESVSAVLLYIGVLMNGQLAALQKFLVTSPSPLVASQPAAQSVPPPSLGG